MSKLDDLLVEKADLEDELSDLKEREDLGERGLGDEISRVMYELADVKDEIAHIEREGTDNGDEDWFEDEDE